MEACKQECWVKSCIRNFRALMLSCPLGGDERWEKEPNWSPNVLSSGLFWYRVILGRKGMRPSLKEGEESQQTVLGFVHWTHWQNDLSFYKETLGYFGNPQGATGIWTVGSGKNNTSHLHSALSVVWVCVTFAVADRSLICKVCCHLWFQPWTLESGAVIHTLEIPRECTCLHMTGSSGQLKCQVFSL